MYGARDSAEISGVQTVFSPKRMTWSNSFCEASMPESSALALHGFFGLSSAPSSAAALAGLPPLRPPRPPRAPRVPEPRAPRAAPRAELPPRELRPVNRLPLAEAEAPPRPPRPLSPPLPRRPPLGRTLISRTLPGAPCPAFGFAAAVFGRCFSISETLAPTARVLSLRDPCDLELLLLFASDSRRGDVVENALRK